jgi:Helix-turn-helix domain of transposase family ISL3
LYLLICEDIEGKAKHESIWKNGLVNHMINAFFPPAAGSGGLALVGLELISTAVADDGTLVAEVGSTAPAAVECPSCGARRHMTGTRLVRFTDVPRDSRAIILSWRRRHFACTGCHRPSHETVAALQERHRVTTRLVDWIWQQAGKTTFMDLAKRCGLSQRTIITLFKEANGEDATRRPGWPFNLGVALIRIAGLPRPVVIDVETGNVVEVYRSLEWFETHLGVQAMHEASSHRLTLDLNLHELEGRFRAAFRLDRFLVPPASAGRHATDLMLQAAGAAIAAQAREECKAAKTRLILFSRRRNDLGRVGQRQLFAWSNQAPVIACAYDLKEELLNLCNSWREEGWRIWKEEAARLPGSVNESAGRIDFRAVISLIDRYAEAIAGYQDRRIKGEFLAYERTLAALAARAPSRTRSFTGARAAILQEFGRRPDSGKGAVVGAARGD